MFGFHLQKGESFFLCSEDKTAGWDTACITAGTSHTFPIAWINKTQLDISLCKWNYCRYTFHQILLSLWHMQCSYQEMAHHRFYTRGYNQSSPEFSDFHKSQRGTEICKFFVVNNKTAPFSKTNISLCQGRSTSSNRSGTNSNFHHFLSNLRDKRISR